MTNQDLAQIQNLVTTARRVLILTHKNPSVDTMASCLSLYLALATMGKDVTVAMESQPLVAVANLVGIDKVKTSLAGKNLTVTYKPYALGDFEKVTYMEDQGQAGTLDDSFKLTIAPREGFIPDPKNFNFSYSGAAADLLITVDVLEPTQTGTLYDQGLFTNTPIINIDNHNPNTDYGKFNLVEPEAASISEIVTFLLRAINTKIEVDIAGNLYQGILDATQNLQSPKVAAATLEAAAICLRGGAKKAIESTVPGQVPAQSQPQPVINSQPLQNPVTQQQPVAPTTPPVTNPNGIPADWMGPKSYRGTSSV